MSDAIRKPRKAVALSELVAGVLSPITKKRGYQLADLKAAWAEIAGPRYAECTAPERIDWPRNAEPTGRGVLRVRAEGAKAVLLQHELGQMVERVNAFFGHETIGSIRLVQGPVARRMTKPREKQPAPIDDVRLANAVAPLPDDPLKAALERLGRGVFRKRT